MQQALRILRVVDAMVSRSERRVGRKRLLAFVNAIDPRHVDAHVDYYRGLIRNNAWPNNADSSEPDMGRFLTGFGKSAQAYVTAGFTSLSWLLRPVSSNFHKVHRKVLAAEALRGLFGKSSPVGLDQRLERCADELLEYLDSESQLITLGTLPSPFRSAESSLIRDFQCLRLTYPEPPNADQLVSQSESADLAWQFIRRHTRWRVDALASVYDELRDHCPETSEQTERRLRTAEERSRLVQSLPPEAANLADFLLSLNYLNLALEPAHSFKSGIGLLNGLIFRASEHHGSTPSERQLVLDRNHLYNTQL